MKNIIKNFKRHNRIYVSRTCIGLNTSKNSNLKRKCTERSRKQTHKTVLKTKSRNKNYQQKGLHRIDNIFGET